MLDKNIFAINMKNFRKKYKLSQHEVSKILDINRTSLINYENAKTLPDINLLLNICDLYNCSINDLFGLNPDKNYYANVPLNTIDDIDSKIKTLNKLIFENIKLNDELISMKNKFSLNINKISTSQKKLLSYVDSISDLSNKFETTYSNLMKSINFYKKSSEDIDETRTYFLNSFSSILENAQLLVNELKLSSVPSSNVEVATDNKTTTSLDTELSTELIPEVDCDNSNYADDEDFDTVDIPVISSNIAAGEPIGYLDTDACEFIRLKAKYPLTLENYKEFYVLNVSGNSMNKIVKNNTKILVHATNCVENGTIAAINLVEDGSSTLKYYYYDQINNTITLSPYSTDPSYTDMVFDADEHRIIVQGKYIGPISDFL